MVRRYLGVPEMIRAAGASGNRGLAPATVGEAALAPGGPDGAQCSIVTPLDSTGSSFHIFSTVEST